jgi:hypothetical protein
VSKFTQLLKASLTGPSSLLGIFSLGIEREKLEEGYRFRVYFDRGKEETLRQFEGDKF